MRQVLGPGPLGRPRGIRQRGRWEGGLGWEIHVYPWLIHAYVWQKPLQYCKVISLQLIIIIKKAFVLWCSAFFIVQLSCPYMTTGKAIALTTRTFVDKVMSPLFNTLSRTLPRRCQLHPFLRRDDHRCLQTLPDVPWGWGHSGSRWELLGPVLWGVCI